MKKKTSKLDPAYVIFWSRWGGGCVLRFKLEVIQFYAHLFRDIGFARTYRSEALDRHLPEALISAWENISEWRAISVGCAARREWAEKPAPSGIPISVDTSLKTPFTIAIVISFPDSNLKTGSAGDLVLGIIVSMKLTGQNALSGLRPIKIISP